MAPYIVGFDDLVTSFVATIATGWSDPCRVGLSPTGKPRLYAAHEKDGLATHLGVSRVALSELVNEKRSVSIEMAQRLGKALGNGSRFWLALQMQHDIWHAERVAKISIKPLKWKAATAA